MQEQTKTLDLLKERDKQLRNKILDIKEQNHKKEKHISSSLIHIRSQLSKIKWMLQIYQNSSISKDDENYEDFEKLQQISHSLMDDVQNLLDEIKGGQF